MVPRMPRALQALLQSPEESSLDEVEQQCEKHDDEHLEPGALVRDGDDPVAESCRRRRAGSGCGYRRDVEHDDQGECD